MSGVISVDWCSLKSGSLLYMKDFPNIKILKLDNSKGCYFVYNSDPQIVNIKEYISEKNGSYYFFKLGEDDWHPLTRRLWKEYD